MPEPFTTRCAAPRNSAAIDLHGRIRHKLAELSNDQWRHGEAPDIEES